MAWSRRRRWTDDELRAAIASSSSYREAIRKLGLSGRGSMYWTIKHRVSELDLDVAHFTASRRAVDANRLRDVVAASTSFMQVLQALGLPSTGAEHEAVRRRITRLGVDARHLTRARGSSGRRARWTDEQLRAAVSSSQSVAEVLRVLGLIPAGGNYESIHRRIRELALDTSHMTGGAWSRARTLPIDRGALASVLVVGRHVGSHKLKQRLFRAGIKSPACELCGWAERATDGRIPVELDHINGDRTDNRLENLRILCPNCHALQPTHRGLNQRRRRAKT